MSDVRRDSNGRFVQGGPGGPGRKSREVEAEYLSTMTSFVDVECWEAIVKKAAVDAVAGDSKARAWLSSYMLGMPISRAEEPETRDKVAEMIEQWRQAKLAMAQELGEE